MPKELPDTAQLWQGLISFFSIDTDLIQSAGYNFDEGALRHLPSQLPAAMNLQLTEIIVREIVSHQMEPIRKAADSLRAASQNLSRIGALNLKNVDNQIAEIKIENTAELYFTALISAYTSTCRGGIIPIEGANITNEMFDRYFRGIAPFGKRKEKKSEFPDAANMLLLEAHAKQHNTKGIIASRDGGVEDFAATSEYLYCVKSLDELAALFVATSDHAQKIKDRIVTEISTAESTVRDHIYDHISHHINDSSWIVGDLYSGTVSHVEGYIYEQNISDLDINLKSSEIWESIDETGLWIFEVMITANVNVSVDVSFYVHDPIDHDQIQIAQQPYEVEKEIKIRAFIRLSNVSEDNPPEEWEVEVDTARSTYTADVGEVNPDFDGD